MQVFLMILVTSVGVLPACLNRANVQCEQDSNCDLSGGGVCIAAPTGNKWCAYPEPGCRNGYRYSTQAVGDGVSGACVAGTDAGTEAQSPDAGPPPSPASCEGLPSTCGASGNDSCCNSPELVGGAMYYRSYDRAGDGKFGDLSFPATVSSFRLDKYEVTVGRFRAFVAAGMGTQVNPPAAGAGAHPNIPGSGWQASWNTSLAANAATLVARKKCDPTSQTWTDTPGANESRPMNCITWFEAMAFCVWDGGYLPTETEWNYAATGGDQQRAYPWSSPPGSLILDSSHANYNLSYLIMVGTKPQGDGRWGQSDLAGNVNEWTFDWYAPYPSSCKDCANLSVASTRVLRGGYFGSPDVIYLRAGARIDGAPTYANGGVGVRCARSVQ